MLRERGSHPLTHNMGTDIDRSTLWAFPIRLNPSHPVISHLGPTSLIPPMSSYNELNRHPTTHTSKKVPNRLTKVKLDRLANTEYSVGWLLAHPSRPRACTRGMLAHQAYRVGSLIAKHVLRTNRLISRIVLSSALVGAQRKASGNGFSSVLVEPSLNCSNVCPIDEGQRPSSYKKQNPSLEYSHPIFTQQIMLVHQSMS